MLLDRDAEYRRANAAEQLVEELSDARVLKEKYERLISEKKRDIEEKDVSSRKERIYPPAGTEAALPGAQNVGGDV